MLCLFDKKYREHCVSSHASINSNLFCKEFDPWAIILAQKKIIKDKYLVIRYGLKQNPCTSYCILHHSSNADLVVCLFL